MKKIELAKQINYKADVARIIKTNYELDFTEGSIYDNRGKAESWSDRSRSTQKFMPESDGKIEYVLYCDDVPCHLVDYDNENEVEILGAENCRSEAEVLVSPETKMKIVSGPQEIDFEEMGYYVIHLELI